MKRLMCAMERSVIYDGDEAVVDYRLVKLMIQVLKDDINSIIENIRDLEIPVNNIKWDELSITDLRFEIIDIESSLLDVKIVVPVQFVKKMLKEVRVELEIILVKLLPITDPFSGVRSEDELGDLATNIEEYIKLIR